MALERKLLTISPVPFTSNGSPFGVVTVADTINFKDKQIVYIQSVAYPLPTSYQIKRVISNTQFIIGPIDGKIIPSDFSNISQFLVSDNAVVGAGEQDKLAQPTDKDHYFAIYESSPVNADRVIPVDPYGNLIGPQNPLPVAFDGTVTVGDVVVVDATTKDPLKVNIDGSINVNVVETPVSGNSVVNTYNEVNSVASGATTTVVQYTLSLAKTSGILYRISVSGENIAKFTVFINSTQLDTRRTYYGSALNEYFEFTTGTNNGVALSPGDVVVVKVLHNRPYTASFEGRIQVLEIS